MVLKDEKNKKAHSKSSHMASEAAGSIRTVASLTREEDCLRIYQKALEIPLHNSNRSAIRSNLLYAVTQALSFFVIALVFYVGATWIADGRYPTNAFFTVLNSVVFASIQAGSRFFLHLLSPRYRPNSLNIQMCSTSCPMRRKPSPRQPQFSSK